MGDAARQQRPRLEGELRERVRAALAQAFLAALRQPLPAFRDLLLAMARSAKVRPAFALAG